jgi:hypothetical protein
VRVSNELDVRERLARAQAAHDRNETWDKLLRTGQFKAAEKLVRSAGGMLPRGRVVNLGDYPIHHQGQPLVVNPKAMKQRGTAAEPMEQEGSAQAAKPTPGTGVPAPGAAGDITA